MPTPGEWIQLGEEMRRVEKLLDLLKEAMKYADQTESGIARRQEVYQKILRRRSRIANQTINLIAQEVEAE